MKTARTSSRRLSVLAATPVNRSEAVVANVRPEENHMAMEGSVQEVAQLVCNEINRWDRRKMEVQCNKQGMT